MTDLSLTPEVTGDFGLVMNQFKMEKQRKRLLCAAAVMGHTNMGQPCPTKEQVVEWMACDVPRWPWRLTNYVEAVSGHLFESDEHYDIFLEEAEGWLETVRKPEFLDPWSPQKALFE